MTQPTYSIKYGKESIPFDIIYTQRKTLEIAVHPNYAVIIKAPFDTALDKIESRIKKRAGWIKRQIEYFRQFDPRTSPREYVSGENHLYLGRRYRLKIEQGMADGIRLSGGLLHITSKSKPNPHVTKELLDNWYRKLAIQKFEQIFEERWAYFSSHVQKRPQIQIKKMKTRWGSLSQGGTLTLNPDLIRAPRECIDYVITHELCHLLHHDHGQEFYKLLERVMPDWTKQKTKLELALI